MGSTFVAKSIMTLIDAETKLNFALNFLVREGIGEEHTLVSSV